MEFRDECACRLLLIAFYPRAPVVPTASVPSLPSTCGEDRSKSREFVSTQLGWKCGSRPALQSHTAIENTELAEVLSVMPFKEVGDGHPFGHFEIV